MAGQPRRQQLVARLTQIAVAELGEGATALDWVEDFVASGGMFNELAERLSRESGESISRQFVSQTANGLTDDAPTRIAAARRDSAAALVENTITIADTSPETTAGVQKAKLRANTRQWLAERRDTASFGSKPPAVHVSLGIAYLEALRAPPPTLVLAPATPTEDAVLIEAGSNEAA